MKLTKTNFRGKHKNEENKYCRPVGCDETLLLGLLFFYTVLVARLGVFYRLAFLIPFHAPERPHFLNWMERQSLLFPI